MQRLTKPLQPQLTDGPPASSSPAASTAMPTLSTLNATSDVNSSRPAALSQPAAFLSSAHDTVKIPATFNAVSDAENSGATAASQPAFVAAMSTTTKFHAVSDAKSCGPSAVSQPGAFPVATTAAAASVPTAVPPDAKSCSLSSTSQPAALLAADSTGSTTPPVLANANSMSANDTPNFPSPTASQADDSSAEMDFTASPENNHNTPTPESAWSTVGTSRKPASTARPRTELISVGIQLPPGTLTPKLPLYDLLAAIISAAHLSSKTSAEITLQAKPAQSLVFLKTQSPLTAHLLLSLTHLQLNGKPISVKTYAPNPPISCLGVIHNVGSHFTPAQLMHDLESFTTDILAARMMGTTESVLITFAGTVIPHFVYFKRVAFRCRPHKPKPPTCTRCLALGHRAHQCPQHSVPAKCRRCAAPLPADSTAHVCAQPWCIHCQVNTHSSLDPTCPFLLAKQRECAKAAFLRRTALRRATQATPSSASSSAHHESTAPPTPSPPGSYAATVKGSSASASLSSATIPSPSLVEQSRSFDLRLTMLERHQREQQRISHELQQQIHTLTQTLQTTTSSLTSQLTKLNEHISTLINPSSNAQVAPLADLIETTTTAHHSRLDTLQRGLDLIGFFLTTAGLSPAPEKSELLLLNHSAYQRSHNALICLHLSGSPIPIVSQCKVLGFPLHAAKNAHALHHAVTTCHSVTHLLRRVVTRRSGLHEAHACRVAHALALNKFLYFVPYVSFTNTQLNTLETALLGLYKAALNLPITTSTAKVFATGLFHPLHSLLSLHRDSQVARLSLTRQGQWLLAQAGISPIPVSTFTSPISTPAPNLRILPLPSNMSPVLHAGRHHAAAQHHVPPFTTQGVAYTDASFVAPRGSCGYAIYHPHLPAPETHTSGPFLHPPDALSLEVLAIAHAL
ncbi:hypothetical protein HPB49_005342 [Dermacentor silvarum]|uniref:Uncharacterized protein n=1 Tax=Dermacentor silvarum TaxID=543639 RepID=A0ACB8DN86_DERSI|nr:hypothetical protein HPB49_005342 [Dermacentor silvarum]